MVHLWKKMKKYLNHCDKTKSVSTIKGFMPQCKNKFASLRLHVVDKRITSLRG